MGDSGAAEVVIVGGGLAGSALAIRLASSGIHTAIVERHAQPRWRACGVFSSPLTKRRLVELGVPFSRVAALQRPISALELETISGTRCRIEYRHGYASGFDRPALDLELLDRAREAGAEVRTGVVARSLRLRGTDGTDGAEATLLVSGTDVESGGEPATLTARVVVGADGRSSLVARSAGALAGRHWLAKSGVTFHRPDPTAEPDGNAMVGRFVFGEGWYVGVAPVPRSRVNVGMVLPPSWLADPRENGVKRALSLFPGTADAWMSLPTTDSVAVAGRLTHRVKRVAGPGFLLVGDAAGFIDPLTGEGIHRALVTAELAADAISAYLRGDRQALEGYDRRVRSRFFGKNLVSWILQGFLMSPRVFDYTLRRLARRADLRDELTLVLTDQRRASRVVQPAYITRLLAP